MIENDPLMTKVKFDLKPCPFCGSEVEVKRLPLWNGSHGYHDCYKYVIECDNPECGCALAFNKNDTIYRSHQEALENIISAWNRRSFYGFLSDEEHSLRIIDDGKGGFSYEWK